MKEIAFIKESKPYIEELKKLKDKIYEFKGQQIETGAGLGDLKDEIAKIKGKIDKLTKTQDDKQTFIESI